VIGQLRVMLGAIRSLDHPTAGLEPAAPSGLRWAREFVARLDAAGVTTAVQVTGDVTRVPAATAQTAEGILRESLTNVRRHAGAHRADVAIDVGADAVRLRIADDGVGVRLAPDGGCGIAGMRERAALAGGTFTVVPRAEGGTLVEAALPLD
jgi:signal transduction histidine kinase